MEYRELSYSWTISKTSDSRHSYVRLNYQSPSFPENAVHQFTMKLEGIAPLRNVQEVEFLLTVKSEYPSNQSMASYHVSVLKDGQVKLSFEGEFVNVNGTLRSEHRLDGNDILKYLTKDLTITCRISEKRPMELPKLEKGVHRAKEVLRKIYEEKLHPDVVISTLGKHFPCHKAILAAASSDFLNMIREGETVLHLRDDFSSNVIENMLKFIYNAEVDVAGDTEMLMDCAEFYKIRGLKDAIEDKIKDKVNVQNATDLLKLALDRNMPNLTKTILTYLSVRNDKVLSSSP